MAKAHTLLVTSSQESSTEPNYLDRRNKFMPSQPCSHGELAGIPPTLQAQFLLFGWTKIPLSLLKHKSSNSISQASSAKGWGTSVLQHKPCSFPSAQTQRAALAHSQGLPSAFCCPFYTFSSARLSMECAHPKAQRVQCTGARPEGGSEPFPWWNCKKIGTVLVVLALKKVLPSTRSDWVCWWLRTEPEGAMSHKKNMGLNYKLSISKAVTDPIILKYLETAQFKFNSLLLPMLMILAE